MTHVSPTTDARTAKAPYNFVRLPEVIAIPPDNADEYDQSEFTELSGYIDLEFTTLSPLYVRGMLTRVDYEEFGKKRFAELNGVQKEKVAQFFAYNNTPVIPGSSLRGMFRTLIEVASYSKISEVTDKRLIQSIRHGRRQYYERTPKDCIPTELNIEKLDMAERLFGYVKKDRQEKTVACGGRIFFEDGVFTQDAKLLGTVTPKVLGSPNPTAYELYLEQYTPDDETKLIDYNSNKATIRGNKFYWSKGSNPDYKAAPNEVPVNMQTKINPIASNSKFNSRIRFENLTKEELGCLLWVLRLGASDKHCLRIGMVKPYGLGAVRIINQKLTLIDRKSRYKNLGFSDENPPADILDLQTKTINVNHDIDKYIRDFKEWISNQLKTNEDFEKLERIRELKILHKWYSEPNDNFNYMTLNEFRDRKVLPNALDAPYRPGAQSTSQANFELQDDVYIKAEITGKDAQGNYLCKTTTHDYKDYELILMKEPVAWGKPFIGQVWNCKITPENFNNRQNGQIVLIGTRPVRKKGK